MYTKQPKKMVIVNILDILKKYTDENHRLSQRDIIGILKSEYDMEVDRKTVKRNIMDLIDSGCRIEYSEAKRMVTNKVTGEPEESYILSDFYLERDFTDSELRLLIDGLLFSKHIPYSQCRELVGKLEGLSNKYFSSKVKYISTLPESEHNVSQLFYSIDILNEAISKGKQVSFCYGEYGTDKKFHAKKNGDVDYIYTVNPYQMAAASGRYYLICNYDKYDDVANCRVDRIIGIKLLDTPVKPARKVCGMEKGFDLPRHMAEHIYMFSGGSERVTFKAKKYILNDIFDWFGKDIDFSDETSDEVTVSVRVNLNAMRRWALQYALHMRVLTPESLADEVRGDIIKAAANYGIDAGEEK